MENNRKYKGSGKGGAKFGVPCQSRNVGEGTRELTDKSPTELGKRWASRKREEVRRSHTAQSLHLGGDRETPFRGRKETQDRG